MKKLINVKGVKSLGKVEQRSISGGRKYCQSHYVCGPGNCCSNNVCYPFGTPGHLCTYFDDF